MTIVKTQLGSEESARRLRFEPTGSISATDTQRAIEEVASEAAPTDADYLVKTASSSLSAERVVTDTDSVTWDWTTAGQTKAKRAALTGEVTASADSNATTIANDVVTFAKMQNIATDRLLGRDTAASGDPEELTVGGGIEFTGSGGIQTSALTGDVTKAAGGTATTIAADVVTNAKMADMAQSTIKGRAAGAGTGDPADLTATQATAILDAFTGDSGSGGVKGLVPAPASGDAAAGKFLKADGTWASGAGGIGGSTGSTDNAALRADGTGGTTAQASPLIIADTTGALSRSGGGGIPVQGTNTNDSAASGYIGEFVSSEVLAGSAVSLTNNVAANVTSISLTAGDWDVSGVVAVNPDSGTTSTDLLGWISTTSASIPTFPNSGGMGRWIGSSVGNTNTLVGLSPKRVSISATTTVYLSIRSAFSGSTSTGFGFIGARRIR